MSGCRSSVARIRRRGCDGPDPSRTRGRGLPLLSGGGPFRLNLSINWKYYQKLEEQSEC